jgi:hypothetical protein
LIPGLLRIIVSESTSAVVGARAVRLNLGWSLASTGASGTVELAGNVQEIRREMLQAVLRVIEGMDLSGETLTIEMVIR